METKVTKDRLREALQYLVDELDKYAAKEGLGPVRLQQALFEGRAALASPAQPVAAPAEERVIQAACELAEGAKHISIAAAVPSHLLHAVYDAVRAYNVDAKAISVAEKDKP